MRRYTNHLLKLILIFLLLPLKAKADYAEWLKQQDEEEVVIRKCEGKLLDKFPFGDKIKPELKVEREYQRFICYITPQLNKKNLDSMVIPIELMDYLEDVGKDEADIKAKIQEFQKSYPEISFNKKFKYEGYEYDGDNKHFRIVQTVECNAVSRISDLGKFQREKQPPDNFDINLIFTKTHYILNSLISTTNSDIKSMRCQLEDGSEKRFTDYYSDSVLEISEFLTQEKFNMANDFLRANSSKPIAVAPNANAIPLCRDSSFLLKNEIASINNMPLKISFQACGNCRDWRAQLAKPLPISNPARWENMYQMAYDKYKRLLQNKTLKTNEVWVYKGNEKECMYDLVVEPVQKTKLPPQSTAATVKGAAQKAAQHKKSPPKSK